MQAESDRSASPDGPAPGTGAGQAPLALLMFVLTAAFAVRVAAQALQYWLPQDFLPPFGAFQGSDLPYPVLLAAQLLILTLMLQGSRRARAGTLRRRAATGGLLLACGAIYMTGSLARIVIGVTAPQSPGWFHAWIPELFHLVLAGYVLALAAWHRRRVPA